MKKSRQHVLYPTLRTADRKGTTLIKQAPESTISVHSLAPQAPVISQMENDSFFVNIQNIFQEFRIRSCLKVR